MLVLSGVFNTIIVDTTNNASQDYMCVNYTLIVVYSMLLVTGSQLKTSHVLPGYGPTAIADLSIIVQCHILVKHGF
jgi:hypothetical protein